jgi:hypothetical protein
MNLTDKNGFELQSFISGLKGAKVLGNFLANLRTLISVNYGVISINGEYYQLNFG